MSVRLYTTTSPLLTILSAPLSFSFFFFNDTATTEIYTLSLHDALPIWLSRGDRASPHSLSARRGVPAWRRDPPAGVDRKSTRLNSSHTVISYAVFCLKKKKTKKNTQKNNTLIIRYTVH